jgi:hypothetical protein
MGQFGRYLRKVVNGYSHWCPGCGEMHTIFDNWEFNGNPDCPTFSPSVKITGVKTVVDERGEWTGEWVRDAEGKAVPDCCHYFLTDAKLIFCADSLHELAGKTVDLPELPEWLRDPPES